MTLPFTFVGLALLALSVTASGAPAGMYLSALSGETQQLILQGAPAGIRVRFVDGVRDLGVAAVDNSGTAQLTIGALSSGPHILRAMRWSTGEAAGETLKCVVPSRPASRLNFTASYAAGVPAGVFLSGVSVSGVSVSGGPHGDLMLGGPTGVSLIHKRDGGWSTPRLLEGTTSSTGAAPTAITVLDFNGDGLNDLAISYADGRVAVLLGLSRSDYRFSAASYYTAGAHPSSIASADFNGDGIPDLAVANQDSNDISILYGNGDGTFKSAMAVPAGYSPRALAAADFNGDGVPDLAIANFATNDVTILLGDGHGGFQRAGVFAAGSGPVSLVAADFDEDGTPDLAVLNQIDGTVSVLLNDGSGVFRNESSIAGVSAIAAGDVDGDGHVDLLLHAGDEIQVRRGAGDGNFVEGYRLHTVGSSLLVAPQDNIAAIVSIDENGVITTLSRREAPPGTTIDPTGKTRLEGGSPVIRASSKGMPHVDDPLATSSSATVLTTSANPIAFGQSVNLMATVSPATATGRVTFFDGTTLLGTRTLANGQAAMTTNMLPANAQSLKAYYSGDANFTASTSGVMVETVNGQLASGFQPAVSYAAGAGPAGVAIADLNGDGKADLVVVNSGTYPDYVGSVTVLLGKGDGTFQAPTGYATGTGSNFVAIADVNGDGNPDVVVANWGGTVSVLTGKGDGTFLSATSYGAGDSPYSLVVGDFNGDGIADIAVANNGDNTVSLLLGSGNGTFSTGITLSAAIAPESIIAGDFNGDGNADLAVAGSNGVVVLLGTGNANFRPPVLYVAGVNPYSIAAGDFNGDGKIDLGVGNLNGGNVSVLLGNGDGTFQAPVNYASGINSEYVAAGDFNGDGNTDLAVANFGPSTGTGGNLSVFYGNGDGTFQVAQHYTAGATPFFVAVGNLNGDGRPDLVTADLNGNSVDILLGTPAFPPAVDIDAPAAGAVVASGTVMVTGWAIDNSSSIANVVVKVDGTVAGKATYGISRPDVCGAYPGRPGCPNVGYSYVLNTSALTAGPHTISVSATDSDSVPDTATASVTITVSTGQLPMVFIDNPAPGSVLSGALTISGWAVDSSSSGTAISNVQVRVDGNVVGNATYGINRGDVCASASYSGRPGCPNVGFSYQLGASTLTAGAHTITVLATDSDPSPDTGSASVTVSVPGASPSVAIDSPAPGAVLSGTVTVSGWAIDSTVSVGPPIGSVVVKVDGNVVGNATYGISRSDVCGAYPGRAGCPNVGYTYALDTTKFTPGPHTLTVVATGTDSNSDTGSNSLTFQVSPPPSVFIDSLAPGSTISGIVTVAGWALDNITTIGTAISSVQVKVDGTPMGNAVYGTSRGDVCSAYPGRPGCPNVGFTYQLNTALLNVGTHTITVVATDSDTNPDTGSASITVTK